MAGLLVDPESGSYDYLSSLIRSFGCEIEKNMEILKKKSLNDINDRFEHYFILLS